MNSCERCGQPRAFSDHGCPSCGFNPATAALDTGAIDINTTEAMSSAGSELPDDVCSLVVTKGPGAGERFLLLGESGATFSVGRSADTEIFLDDVTVSRHHGTFTRQGSSWFFQDGGSLNGTYVNGSRIESASLTDGDMLIIGRFTMRFTGQVRQ